MPDRPSSTTSWPVASNCKAGIREMQQEHSTIMTQVRGLGLMVGTEFNNVPLADAVEQHYLDEGHLVAPPVERRHLRSHPPSLDARRWSVQRRRDPFGLAAAFSAALKATA